MWTIESRIQRQCTWIANALENPWVAVHRRGLAAVKWSVSEVNVVLRVVNKRVSIGPVRVLQLHIKCYTHSFQGLGWAQADEEDICNFAKKKTTINHQRRNLNWINLGIQPTEVSHLLIQIGQKYLGNMSISHLTHQRYTFGHIQFIFGDFVIANCRWRCIRGQFEMSRQWTTNRTIFNTLQARWRLAIRQFGHEHWLQHE